MYSCALRHAQNLRYQQTTCASLRTGRHVAAHHDAGLPRYVKTKHSQAQPDCCMQLEEQRRKNEPPSDMELVRRAEKDTLHANALASQQEQRDEVKAMSAMLAYAKCAAIRWATLPAP